MVTFRRPPRSPPPKPPTGKNVIPFDVKRTRPPGVKSLGELKPDPDNLINLEQIKKAKDLELRNAIQSEGMSPFPEGKGLSGLGEETPVKDLPKENISSPEDQQLFILNRERMTPEQRAMRERDDKVMLNDLATLDMKLLNKRERDIRSDLDKLMREDPRSDKKNSQGLPLTRTRIAVDRHYLDMIVAEIKRREEKGLSGIEEPPKKFKGVHEAIKDLSESMEKFNERHAPLLEREGLSGVKDRKATQDVIEIPAKTNTDKYIRERITNPDQPKLAGDELQKEIMKFTEGHSGNEDIISVLQRQIDDISDIGLPANREKLSQIYVRTVDKGGFKVLTINRKADDVIMGLVYPSLKGDTMIWQASPTMRRKSLVTWTPLGKTEGDYDLVTAQGKPITRRESGFQNVGEVTVTDPKKRGRSVMEGLRVMLNYMEHEMQYYYDKSQGLNPTWTDPELNK